MSGARVWSRALVGLTAHAVQVECHITNGLPSTTIVGMPQGSVKESKDRVRSALKNLGFQFPEGRVVINLAPAEIRKSSTGLDLPIAISLLAASKQISSRQLNQFEFIGELGLFGELRPVQGVIASLLAAHGAKRRIIMPAQHANEAGLIPDAQGLTATNLLHVTALLQADQPELAEVSATPNANAASVPVPNQVVGQQAAKRALMIAAAGGHHMLMVGPPGSGKTLLAENLRCLIPSLNHADTIDVARIYSSCGQVRADYTTAPFRAPHHTATGPALLGGGSPPAPGELAMAHKGVLFLDELPHFKPSVLNQLREPLESGVACISRAEYRVEFPCEFQLIAAMNPCPAGRSCRADSCRCDPAGVTRYQSRISGPILDRIDLHVHVPELDPTLLKRLDDQAATDWQGMAKAVAAAQRVQTRRQGKLNAKLGTTEVQAEIRSAQVDESYLQQAIKQFQLSARSYHKLWRIARTIADLGADLESDLESNLEADPDAELESDARESKKKSNKNQITQAHLIEALSYRSMDWERGVK